MTDELNKQEEDQPKYSDIGFGSALGYALGSAMYNIGAALAGEEMGGFEKQLRRGLAVRKQREERQAQVDSVLAALKSGDKDTYDEFMATRGEKPFETVEELQATFQVFTGGRQARLDRERKERSLPSLIKEARMLGLGEDMLTELESSYEDDAVGFHDALEKMVGPRRQLKLSGEIEEQKIEENAKGLQKLFAQVDIDSPEEAAKLLTDGGDGKTYFADENTTWSDLVRQGVSTASVGAQVNVSNLKGDRGLQGWALSKLTPDTADKVAELLDMSDEEFLANRNSPEYKPAYDAYTISLAKAEDAREAAMRASSEGAGVWAYDERALSEMSEDELAEDAKLRGEREAAVVQVHGGVLGRTGAEDEPDDFFADDAAAAYHLKKNQYLGVLDRLRKSRAEANAAVADLEAYFTQNGITEFKQAEQIFDDLPTGAREEAKAKAREYFAKEEASRTLGILSGIMGRIKGVGATATLENAFGLTRELQAINDKPSSERTAEEEAALMAWASSSEVKQLGQRLDIMQASARLFDEMSVEGAASLAQYIRQADVAMDPQTFFRQPTVRRLVTMEVDELVDQAFQTYGNIGADGGSFFLSNMNKAMMVLDTVIAAEGGMDSAPQNLTLLRAELEQLMTPEVRRFARAGKPEVNAPAGEDVGDIFWHSGQMQLDASAPVENTEVLAMNAIGAALEDGVDPRDISGSPEIQEGVYSMEFRDSYTTRELNVDFFVREALVPSGDVTKRGGDYDKDAEFFANELVSNPQSLLGKDVKLGEERLGKWGEVFKGRLLPANVPEKQVALYDSALKSSLLNSPSRRALEEVLNSKDKQNRIVKVRALSTLMLLEAHETAMAKSGIARLEDGKFHGVATEASDATSENAFRAMQNLRRRAYTRLMSDTKLQAQLNDDPQKLENWIGLMLSNGKKGV